MLRPEDLERLREAGNYRYIVVHERGFYLLRSGEGATLYRGVVRRLEQVLGIQATETVEQEAFDWPGKARSFPAGLAWVPWGSQEVQLPAEEMPSRYLMAVFDLAQLKVTVEEAAPAPAEAEPGSDTQGEAPPP